MMQYLGWYDDNPKHDIAAKVFGAIAAYRERYSYAPTVALVCADDLLGAQQAVGGIQVRSEPWVRRNIVLVGYE